jgi:integrase
MRDRRHLESAAAADQRDWLAYLELGGLAVTTRDAYERTTAALLVAYPDVAFGEFTDSHLLQFLLLFPKKSQRIRKAHLASWFRWGRKVRRIQSNPVELLPDIKRHQAKIPDLFTDGEVAILEALPLPDGPLMSLLFGAGLRKAEARHLTARRIDFPHRRVIVSEGAKGSRDRAVPMLDELASPLANLLLLEGVDPGEHLWYTRAGGAHRVIRRQNPRVRHGVPALVGPLPRRRRCAVPEHPCGAAHVREPVAATRPARRRPPVPDGARVGVDDR